MIEPKTRRKSVSFTKVPASFELDNWNMYGGSDLRSGSVINSEVLKRVALTNFKPHTSEDSWPTPIATDYKFEDLINWLERAAEKSSKNIRLHFALKHAVSMWPTPAHRDYKGQNSIEFIRKNLKAGKNAHLGQLPNAVLLYGNEEGLLNAEWVEWLMGYPPDWTKVV